MRLCTRAVAACAAWACLWTAATVHSHAQGPTPIFIDDFESGADEQDLATSPKWPSANSGGGTVAAGTQPHYQANNNPFPSGALYARLFDNDGASPSSLNLRLVSSNQGGSVTYEPQLSNQITTFSFNFVEATTIATVGNYSIGYTANDDMHSAERIWRATLGGGVMSPDTANEGAAVAYPRGAVATVWMIANDTTTPLANYSGGQTLDAKEADFWIAVGNAAPTFAFSVERQNPTLAPAGFGFRSFAGDVMDLLVDNVLVLPGATLDRSVFGPGPSGPNANFNDQGVVDNADLNLWRIKYGTTTGAIKMDGDADADGNVDGNDFLLWQQQAGTTPPAVAAASAVPEPTAACLAAVALAAVASRRRAARAAVGLVA